MCAKKTPFKSVLVANRGEIALRIMQTAKRLGLQVIAVYTDADREAPHVKCADQAVRIGEGPVGTSYLSVEKILEAAKKTGAEAVHPGYGFLSESSAFATAVAEAGLVFVGPSPQAIDAMGNKAAAKRLMLKAGVPCVPGYEGTDQSDEAFQQAAHAIGYPIMVKAAAGGGGRGMRLVETPDTLLNGLQLARSEAGNAFGSDELILERAILKPRHVEIQIFADRAGLTIHLGERDCSVQRRHQKVIEEAPSPVVSSELRAEMGMAAIEAAKAIGYEGAGTVEFLLDQDGAFYFLEMNTRLQVEHPVTELVTGFDLVAMQFDVASGAGLEVTQDDVALDGHALEVRLYAEDPTNDFLPCAGDILSWQPPTGDNIRVDAGIETGMTISPFYDAMLAKIIAFGANREAARLSLLAALRETILFGVKTNRDFLISLLEAQGFADCSATTAFIAETYGETGPTLAPLHFDDVATMAALYQRSCQAAAAKRAGGVTSALLGWGSAGFLRSQIWLRDGEHDYKLRLQQDHRDHLTIKCGDQTAIATWRGTDLFINEQKIFVAGFLATETELHLATDTLQLCLSLNKSGRQAISVVGDGQIAAPMHGNLLSVFVSQGEAVEKGARLAVLEAMKMQHEILSDVTGVVQTVHVEVGQQMRAKDLMFAIDPTKGAKS